MASAKKKSQSKKPKLQVATKNDTGTKKASKSPSPASCTSSSSKTVSKSKEGEHCGENGCGSKHSKAPRYGHNGSFICSHIRTAAEGFDVGELSTFWSVCYKGASQAIDENIYWETSSNESSSNKGNDPVSSMLQSDEARNGNSESLKQPEENRDRFPQMYPKIDVEEKLMCLRCGRMLSETSDGSDLRCDECPIKQMLCVHVDLLQVFCVACNDFVYHPEFDAARCHAILSSGNRGRYAVLEPGIGLRGMCNLGNTCYMNSTLQVLAQQTSIRDYFLSSEHNDICSVAGAVRGSPECHTLNTSLHALLHRGHEEYLKHMSVGASEAEDSSVEVKTNGKSSKAASLKRKRRKKPVNLLRSWAQERDGSFLARYGINWLRPWSTYADIADPKLCLNTSIHSKTSSSALPASLDPKIALGCIGCELELMIKDMYCGTSTTQPIMLNHFLYSTWQNAPWLSGYMQQDAHEFFSFVVNSIHTASGKPDNDVIRIRDDGSRGLCDCVMHQTLGGILCSQIQCSACGEVSESFEPFFDISLDCPTDQEAGEESHDSKDKSVRSNNSTTSGNNSSQEQLDSTEGMTSDEHGKEKHTEPKLYNKVEHNEKNGQEEATARPEDLQDDSIIESPALKHQKHKSVMLKPSVPSISIPLEKASSPNKKMPMPSPRGGVLVRGLSFFAPPITLESMIDKFLAPEMLMAAIDCDKCKTRKDKCSKRLRFNSLPSVLCFHIKRFKTNSQSGMPQKSDQSIVFPDTNLDLSALVPEGKETPQIYDLCGVIQHTGNIDSGHYFCFILHHGCWYKCDDVFVYRVAREDVLASQAYMLFYKRHQ